MVDFRDASAEASPGLSHDGAASMAATRSDRYGVGRERSDRGRGCA